MQKEDRALLVRHEDPLRPWQSTTILVLWTPFMHFLRGVWLFQFRINKIIFFIPCHISRKYVSSMIFTPKYGMYTLQYHSLTFVYQILCCINFCLILPLLCRIPHCHFNISASTLCTLVFILPLIGVLLFSYLSPTENTL